jgi:hypothetical protein
MTVDFFHVLLMNNKDEVGKIVRLAEFMCLFAAKLKRPMPEVFHLICWLEDEKGKLTITFNTHPQTFIMKLAKEAWEECNEAEIVFQYIETTKTVVEVEAKDGTSV